MSFVVKEPTFIVGYQINPNFVGWYEYSRSTNESRAKKTLRDCKDMKIKKRAKEFDCTECQALNMKLTLISIYPGRQMKADNELDDKGLEKGDIENEEDKLEEVDGCADS